MLEKSLFDEAAKKFYQKNAPLAARIRPQTLGEFFGQEHILGPGRLLERAIEADKLSSLIFYGPPGTGKTTLARIISNTTQSNFISINAVLAGVKDIREAIEYAKKSLTLEEKKTILFIDEVHRFNKSQQDALLPHVENGTIILIGATTENPYFEVNKALVSRSRIFELRHLTDDDLKNIFDFTVKDKTRGYGEKKIKISDDALDHLVKTASGDARSILNALELAVLTTTLNKKNEIIIDLKVAEESIQKRAVLYDKDGDAHYDIISAFIKSVRGSDPDAALYWLAKMVYAGEDPRFIFRRMIILASEDVGLADPNALNVVVNASRAYDYIGMPEGRFPLAEACLYLATAPKSNSVMGFFDAFGKVSKENQGDIPDHLKDASRDADDLGHGKNYLYPHAFKDHWIKQQYLPDAIQGMFFYEPGIMGYEGKIKESVEKKREEQFAQMINAEDKESKTSEDDWYERTYDTESVNLRDISNKIYNITEINRSDLMLIFNSDNGILLWEALRKIKTGGVYSHIKNSSNEKLLLSQLEIKDDIGKPVFISGEEKDIRNELSKSKKYILFDKILGMNIFLKNKNRLGQIRLMSEILKDEGQIVLAEKLPKESQRLYRFLENEILDRELVSKIIEAEDNIYNDHTNKFTNWDEDILMADFLKSNLKGRMVFKEQILREMYIKRERVESWVNKKDPSSYISRIKANLNEEEIEIVIKKYRSLIGRSVKWKDVVAYFKFYK